MKPDSEKDPEAGAVTLWHLAADAVGDPWIGRFLSWFDARERARYGRARSEAHRRLFAVSHGLVRLALSRHAAVAPDAWRFRLADGGRPEPVHPDGETGWRFNLSHTAGMAVCAVRWGGTVGADVEDRRRRCDPERLGRRFFAPEERAWIAAARTDGSLRDRFLRLWTLKESFLKAVGAGLTLPLREAVFSFPAREAPCLRLGSARIADGETDWSFWTGDIGARYPAAVAVTGPACSVRLAEGTALLAGDFGLDVESKP